jgi:hypothetical protein
MSLNRRNNEYIESLRYDVRERMCRRSFMALRCSRYPYLQDREIVFKNF